MTGFSSGSNWPRETKRTGFTLIELLVVLGILGMLIALLFPALTKAQRQARIVTCLTNLRELHLAYKTYIDGENAIPLDPTHQNYWLQVLQPKLPDVPGILSCPEASEPSYGWGDAKTAWGPFDAGHASPASMSFVGKSTSSYGFNGWLYEPAESFSTDELRRRRHLPDHIPVFADANFVEAFPQYDDPLPSDVSRGAGPDDPQMGRFCISRHGPSINAAFLDGHAEQVPLNELRDLRWLARKTVETSGDSSSDKSSTLP